MSEVRFDKRVDWGIADGRRGKHQVAIGARRFQDVIEFYGVTTRERNAAMVSIPINKIDELIRQLHRLRRDYPVATFDCTHTNRGADDICVDCGKDLL
jgi:hypothetical protein